MPPALYAELTPWYHLVDPPEDHADEAACFLEAFTAAIDGPAATLLELGAGAGHNASHLKAHLRCTLTDLSEPMLALSRARNPECAHVAGDMRTLRLGTTFDAVLAHDGRLLDVPRPGTVEAAADALLADASPRDLAATVRVLDRFADILLADDASS